VDGDLRVRDGRAGAEGVELRAATPDDLEAIVGVNRASATAAYASIFGGTPFPEQGIRSRYTALLRDAVIVLAERDGRALGYAAARPGRLEALYVVPEAWGSGLADRLYERAAEVAGPDATLWVLRDNARGRRFWERRGWAPTGEEDTSQAAVELLYRR
jgi:GNAT superfamily N-acetyltransferase